MICVCEDCSSFDWYFVLCFCAKFCRNNNVGDDIVFNAEVDRGNGEVIKYEDVSEVLF